MNPTPTLLAGALLLALATLPAPAQAGPLDLSPVWRQTDRAMDCTFGHGHGHTPCFLNTEPCDKPALGTVCALPDSIGGWCASGEDCGLSDPTDDRDHDLLPDLAERNYCGRSTVRAVNVQAETTFTRCDARDDMSGFADGDRDGLPDDAEPALCGLEDQTTDLDGSCTADGQDYRL